MSSWDDTFDLEATPAAQRLSEDEVADPPRFESDIGELRPDQSVVEGESGDQDDIGRDREIEEVGLVKSNVAGVKPRLS